MSENKQYIRGCKRLAIINKWLRGIDDEDYDVFPTKIEGKYIVKPRDKTSTKNTKPENKSVKTKSKKKNNGS